MGKTEQRAALSGWLSATAVVAVVMGAGYATWAAVHLVAGQPWFSWRLDDAVVAVAAVVVAGCGWHLTWVALVTAVDVVRHHGHPPTIQSSRWRRTVVAACVWVMGGALGTPALALENMVSPGWVDDVVVVSSEAQPDLESAPADSYPAEAAVAWPATQDSDASMQSEPQPVPSSVATAVKEVGETCTVQRGDSLWRITAQLLGPDASDADIAASWPVLYEHNRETIGANPHLIHPGQVLVVPQELAS